MLEEEFEKIKNKEYLYLYILENNEPSFDLVISKQNPKLTSGDIRHLDNEYVFCETLKTLFSNDIKEIIY